MYLPRTIYKIYTTCRSTNALHKIMRFSSTEINIIRSKSAHLTIPKQLIHEYVWEHLDKWYEKTAVVCFESGKSYTFGQLYHKSRSLACALQTKFQLSPGDTVAVVLPNVADFPIAFLGAIQAGFVVTTVNPYYTAVVDEMAAQLNDSGSKLIITMYELLAVVTKATNVLKSKIPTILAESSPAQNVPRSCVKLQELCDISNTITEFPQIDPSDVAVLPYSSGTTGLPKGVQLTHSNVLSNLYQMSSSEFKINFETEGDFQEVIPVFLPLFHIYGMVGVFLNFIAKGCKLIMIPSFIGSQFIKLLHAHRPTLVLAVPPIFVIILNNTKIKYDDLKSIRVIVSAAAPLGITAVEKFNEKTEGKIEILQMYGMTETSPLTLMQSRKLTKGTKIGGSGFLLPNTESKIVAIDDSSAAGLGSYQTGELLVRGPQVMKGYHNNPEATDDVIKDGWLRTGDVCYYDEDQHFFITDRLKELIKVKGFQVAPAELEEILRNHSSVEDAAVVGVSHPVQGEVPKAFVVLKPHYHTSPEQLKEYVASKVANYKRLVGGVVIMDQIPRNRAGKILRKQLRYL